MSRHRVLLKAVVLGDSGVGKTSLMQHFLTRKFDSHYRATIGSDVTTKEFMIEDRMVTMQLWDTAGQERFRGLGTAFYRGSDCCLLVFDVNVTQTFENLQYWHSEFLVQTQLPDPDAFPFVVVGNKVDMANARAVSQKQAMDWCRQKGFTYFETSARDGLNVEQAFTAAARASMREWETQRERDDLVPLPPLSGPEQQEQSGFCSC